MKMKDTETAVMPLLPSVGTSRDGRERARSTPAVTLDMEDDDSDLEVAQEKGKTLFSVHKRRTTSLIWNDAVLLLLHILQVFAVLQGLALRWPFPEHWVKATHFIFLFNFDLWDFSKVQANGIYKEVQDYFIPSATMPLSYWHLLLAWGILALMASIVFVTTYLVITYRKHPFMMIKIANLQRIYVVMLQMMCLPIGTAMARVFHCTDTGVMEVDNGVPCYVDRIHWAYICPCLAMVIIMYGLVPAWMIVRTRAELLNLNADRHEGYLQLKEVEYIQGLDILYVVGRFHMFSSFRKLGSHMRAQLVVFSFCLLLVVASTFQHIFIGALVIGCLLLVLLVASVSVQPFRVACFNMQLSFSYLCLVGFALLGCMRASFTSYTLASAWLTPAYLNVLLPLIALTWLCVTAAFLAYLALRHFGCCSKHFQRPLWPSAMSDDLNQLSPETRKYVRAIILSRTLIERSLSGPPMFAPAHELSRQIQVMNAFCREAEYLADPIHDTLWDVLDELLEAHSQVVSRSLFAESVKDSIRQTAAELMSLMPTMVRRLAQREYDFILVPPLKRRLLFKMYCMGIFLNGRRDKLEKQKLTLPAVERVFKSVRQDPQYEQDDGYYEDMYPELEEGPLARPDTALSLGLFSEAGLDDDVALEEAEEWARLHPLSNAGFSNRGLEDDISAILRDDLSETASAMMDGLPGGSRSVSRLSTSGSGRPMRSRLVVLDGPGSSGHPNSRFTVTAAGRQSIERLASPGHAPPNAATGALAAPGSRPGSGQPRSRPGSAGRRSPRSHGSRPCSASSNNARAGSEWRQSPLPGQVHAQQQSTELRLEAASGGRVHYLAAGVPGQSEA